METIKYIVVVLSIVAGIGVLRNPLKVWPNTLAGISYLGGAAGSLFQNAWWPLLTGWIVSLCFQGICAVMMARGAFNNQINIAD